MKVRDGTVHEVYVQPGETCLVTETSILRTVLGSCVGITFLVPRLNVGALCHPMLPRRPANLSGNHAGTRYVDFAICDVARQLDAMGAVRAETQVKIFGGADVLTVVDGCSRPTVGRLNSESALRTLAEEGFSVVASSLGGDSGVQILFHTDTGEVILRRLNRTETGIRSQPTRKSAQNNGRGDRGSQQGPGTYRR